MSFIVPQTRWIVRPGEKYTRWTVLGCPFSLHKYKQFAVCRCDCGHEAIVYCSALKRNKSLSCGCIKSEIKPALTHGDVGSKLYAVWQSMKRRCNCAGAKEYERYGGRGICVCPEWKFYESFKAWAIESGYGPNLQIDRINNDGNYEPSNCRWITQLEQANNKSTNRILDVFGERKTVMQWSRDERCQVSGHTLNARLHYGWTDEAAITTPLRQK